MLIRATQEHGPETVTVNFPLGRLLRMTLRTMYRSERHYTTGPMGVATAWHPYAGRKAARAHVTDTLVALTAHLADERIGSLLRQQFAGVAISSDGEAVLLTREEMASLVSDADEAEAGAYWEHGEREGSEWN